MLVVKVGKNVKVCFIGVKGFCLKRKIVKVLNTVANLCGINHKLIVNIGYIGESAIQKLNKEKRNVDKVTDVLSFPFFNLKNAVGLDTELQQNKYEVFANGFVEIGDIMICESVAQLQAQNLGHSKKREICFLATHGFLHLLGFDHLNEKDETLMNNLTQKALMLCKVERK